MTFTEEQKTLFREWVQERPEPIQKRSREYPPGKYLNKAYKRGKQVVRIISYSEEEDGSCDTCRVNVLREDNPNLLGPDYEVFGVPFEDLEPLEVLEWWVE